MKRPTTIQPTIASPRVRPLRPRRRGSILRRRRSTRIAPEDSPDGAATLAPAMRLLTTSAGSRPPPHGFLVLLLPSLVLASCSKPDAKVAKADPVASAAPTPSTVPPPPAPKTPAKYACAADADCFMSCGAGAVSKKWWDAWDKSGECKDGCAEMNVAKCRDGRCLAFDYNSGAPNAGCSNRP